jgi:hypothetical protein
MADATPRVQEVQDRRSGMYNSSKNAPPKKAGGGGSYTWGKATDVLDYEPVGLPTGSIGVTSMPIAMSPTASPVTTSTTFQMDQGAFPVLGANVVPRAVSSWGPTAKTVIGPGALRPGTQVFGATHPRNQFAKKPYISSTTVVAPAQERLIDWSKAGMPDALVSAVIQGGAAHLGPYAQAAPVAVPLDTLRARTVATTASYQQQVPKVSQHVAGARRPAKAKVIQQPCGGGR